LIFCLIIFNFLALGVFLLTISSPFYYPAAQCGMEAASFAALPHLFSSPAALVTLAV
jgi:hypothetical protein